LENVYTIFYSGNYARPLVGVWVPPPCLHHWSQRCPSVCLSVTPWHCVKTAHV